MRIGILTGGGDAPGLNGVIESATRTLLQLGHSPIGICDGFEGIFQGKTKPLSLADVEGAHAFAGTLLGTSSRSGTEGREDEFVEAYNDLKLEGLIVAGGDGTFRCLQDLEANINIVGVPKTIDNDLSGTDATFGYDTACSVVADAVDSLRTTASAHQRIIVVETMGRTAGWIALGGGMAALAPVILIPERPFRPAPLKTYLDKKLQEKRGLIIVVSEGFTMGDAVTRSMDASGASAIVADYGIGQRITQWIKSELNKDARHVVLGHLQRSHPPTTTDRFLTTAMGITAARMAHNKQWGFAAALVDGKVRDVPIENLMAKPRLVTPNHRWVTMCEDLGLFI